MENQEPYEFRRVVDEKSQPLLVIDCDLIRNLRKHGRGQEANELLEAFHKDVKKCGKQAYSDQQRKEREIKKHMGWCVFDGCREYSIEGKCCCEKHLNMSRNWFCNKYKQVQQQIKYIGRTAIYIGGDIYTLLISLRVDLDGNVYLS